VSSTVSGMKFRGEFPVENASLDRVLMAQPPHIRRAVLLWVTVTAALWAAIPVTMYLSHWTWFGWMPRIDAPQPAGTIAPPHHGHATSTPMLVNMVTILVMSSVLMAVVLWMLSMRKVEERR